MQQSKVVIFFFFIILSSSVLGLDYINFSNVMNYNFSMDLNSNLTFDFTPTGNISWELIPQSSLNFIDLNVSGINGVAVYRCRINDLTDYKGNQTAYSRNSDFTGYYGNNMKSGLYGKLFSPISSNRYLCLDILLNTTLNASQIIFGVDKFYSNYIPIRNFIGIGLSDTALNDSYRSGMFINGYKGRLWKNTPNNLNFNRIFISFNVGSSFMLENAEFSLTNITFVNASSSPIVFNDTNNELPDVNITYNNSLIILNNQSVANFTFKINAVDPEGDTIYYSTFADSTYYVSTLYDWDKTENDWRQVLNNILYCRLMDEQQLLGLCTNYDKYGVKLNNHIANGEVLTNCPYQTNIYRYGNDTLFFGFDTKQYYKLGVNASKSCDPYPTTDVYFPLNPYLTGASGVGYTIEVTNESYVYVLPILSNNDFGNTIKIENTNGRSLVYEMGELRSNLTPGIIEIDDYYDSNIGIHTLNIIRNGSYSYVNSSSYYGGWVSSILFKGGEGTGYIDDIFGYSAIVNFTWTQQTPNNFTYNKEGYYYINIYVTDSYHLDLHQYVKKTIAVQVTKQNATAVLRENPIVTPFYTFFANFLEDIGILDEILSILWLGWLITIIIFWFVSRNFGDSFLLANGLYFFLSLIGFGNIVTSIGYALLFIVSLMPFLVQLFIPITRR